MKNYTEREVRELLTPKATPIPPDGLAELIQRDIPKDLDLERGTGTDSGRRRPRLKVFLAAASLFVTAGTALLLYREQRTSVGVVVTDLPSRSRGATEAETQTRLAELPPATRGTDGIASSRSPTPPTPEEKIDLLAATQSKAGAASLPAPDSLARLEQEDLRENRQAAEDLATGRLEPEESKAMERSARQQLKRRSRPPARADEGRSSAPEMDIDVSSPIQDPAARSPERGSQALRFAEPSQRIERFTSQGPETRARGRVITEIANASDESRRAFLVGDRGPEHFVETEGAFISIFSLAAGTASYALVRNSLLAGHLPPSEWIRLEELINYLDYEDAPPESDDFAIYAEGAPLLFGEGEGSFLVRIHLRERETGMLQAAIAEEARMHVEWNPEIVSRHRLLGYEDRGRFGSDFSGVSTSTGRHGTGAAVTALYEIETRKLPRRRDTVATLELRSSSEESATLALEITGKDLKKTWEAASDAFRLTALVAEFGKILKGGPPLRSQELQEVFLRTQEVALEFPDNVEIADFVRLVDRAVQQISP